MIITRVPLVDIVTPQSFSYMLSHIVKYISFSLTQVPYDFKLFYCLVDIGQAYFNQIEGKRVHSDQMLSFRERTTLNSFRLLQSIHTSYENLFCSIETELLDHAVEEIIIAFGTTLNTSKNIFIIKLPAMSQGHQTKQHPAHKLLPSLCRAVVTSNELNQLFGCHRGPTNMYVLLKLTVGSAPKTDWYYPNDNFKISSRAELVTFTFDLPTGINCTCLNSACVAPNSSTFSMAKLEREVFKIHTVTNDMSGEMDIGEPFYEQLCALTNKETVYCTQIYQFKDVIRGFKDTVVNGRTLSNFLLSKR